MILNLVSQLGDRRSYVTIGNIDVFGNKISSVDYARAHFKKYVNITLIMLIYYYNRLTNSLTPWLMKYEDWMRKCFGMFLQLVDHLRCL